MAQEVNGFYTADIDPILERSYRQEPVEKAVFDVIFCLGRDAETESEFHYAYAHLMALLEHPDSDVRAYSLLALSMMARNWALDKTTIISRIQKEWATASGLRKGWLQSAAEDLQFLGWDIALPGLE